MSRVRRAAAAWVVDSAGRVLLIRENYGRRRYGPPGGALEDGESPLEAVCREVREETCAGLWVEGLVGVYRFRYARGDNEPWTAFAFAGRLSGAPRVPDTDEIAELGWFDPRALPEPLTNLTRYGLADALAGRRRLRRHVTIP
jgi:ADP-ribose pyrophosphatase YjhB (NUDIX family)